MVGSSSCYYQLKEDAPSGEGSHLPFEGYQMSILKGDAPSVEESCLPFEGYRMSILKEDAPSVEGSCLPFEGYQIDGFLPYEVGRHLSFEEGTQVEGLPFEVVGVAAAVGWKTFDDVGELEVADPCYGIKKQKYFRIIQVSFESKASEWKEQC